MEETIEQPKPDVFEWVPKLTGELEDLQSQLSGVMKDQKKALKDSDEKIYVPLYLKYNEIERAINDRQHVLRLLSEKDNFESEFYRGDFWSYLIAAETIGNELVDALTNEMRDAVKNGFHQYETFEQFHSPYKNFILPGKIIAGKFDELDTTVEELNHYIQQIIPKYDRSKSLEVLPYAFKLAIDADVEVGAIKSDLEKADYSWLMKEEVESLLEHADERLAQLQDIHIKNEQVAADRARDAIVS